ncbi:glycosyltransferase family 4 protein [Sciscionella sediminilitoris]|uniref:glycosyltransferase family 4 protein n=1 Tax=Sciscionella sediminilitoris TaxID=1445613 RepID=UPI0004DF8066|nr:glycosyltransferase family 4 protein [Sciscionella sp. SE31]
MRIGMVCPYSLAVPGGVQAHVLALATALRGFGHTVEVLAPAAGQEESVTSAGRAFAVPYNGSIARLAFGPGSYARVRSWLAEHSFDVLHVHEPAAPSVSMLALLLADCPVVATFHAGPRRSLALRGAAPVLRPLLEKVTARIAVSECARRVQAGNLGLDAVEIGNGVDVPLFAGQRGADGVTVGFAGRFDESRKGFRVLLTALRELAAETDKLRLLVVGGGDRRAARRFAGPALAERIEFLGVVDEPAKARALRAMDVFCAPHLGGESFGMVLVEAMAAGTPVVASELEAFRAVAGGAAEFVPPGEPEALAAALRGLLADARRRAELGAVGTERAAVFDWPVVAAAVERVYDTAIAAHPMRAAA